MPNDSGNDAGDRNNGNGNRNKNRGKKGGKNKGNRSNNNNGGGGGISYQNPTALMLAYAAMANDPAFSYPTVKQQLQAAATASGRQPTGAIAALQLALTHLGFTRKALPPLAFMLTPIVPSLNGCTVFSSSAKLTGSISCSSTIPDNIIGVVDRGATRYWLSCKPNIDGKVGAFCVGFTWGDATVDEVSIQELANISTVWRGSVPYTTSKTAPNAADDGSASAGHADTFLFKRAGYTEVIDWVKDAQQGKKAAVLALAQMLPTKRCMALPMGGLTPQGVTVKGIFTLTSWLALGLASVPATAPTTSLVEVSFA